MEQSEIKKLLAVLDDEDVNKDTRMDAVITLGEIGDSSVTAALVTVMMTEYEDTIGILATKALGKIGDRNAVEPLIKALEKPPIRRYAITSLGMIGDDKAIKPLEELYKDPTIGYPPFAFSDDYEGLLIEEKHIREDIKAALQRIMA